MLFGRPSREGPCALRRAVRLFRFAQRLRRCRSALDDTLCRRRRKFGRKRILAIAVIINRIFVVYVYTLIFLERPDSTEFHIFGGHGILGYLSKRFLVQCAARLNPAGKVPNAVVRLVHNRCACWKCNLLVGLLFLSRDHGWEIVVIWRYALVRKPDFSEVQRIKLLGPDCRKGDIRIRDGELIVSIDRGIVRRPTGKGIALFIGRCACAFNRGALPVKRFLVRTVGVFGTVRIDVCNLLGKVRDLARGN